VRAAIFVVFWVMDEGTENLEQALDRGFCRLRFVTPANKTIKDGKSPKHKNCENRGTTKQARLNLTTRYG
jgi:hypothetical protein